MSFLASLGYDYEYYVEKGNEFLSKKNYGEAKIEFLKAYEICLENEKDTKELDTKIVECDEHLAEKHIEWAQGYEDSEEYVKSISSYNQAIELLKDKKRRNELKKIVEKLLEKNLNKQAQENASEYVSRGDEFIKTNDILDAFTEYKQAYLLVKDISCEFTDALKEKLASVEKKLVDPYIEQAKKAIDENDIETARTELSYANAIIDEFNDEVLAELISLQKKVEENTDNDEKIYVSDTQWDQAIADYREALEKYLSFDYNTGKMITPVYINKYERMYFAAKTKLGELYIKRAEGFLNDKKLNIAERIFVEAKKYFNADSEQYEHIQKKLESLKK